MSPSSVPLPETPAPVSASVKPAEAEVAKPEDTSDPSAEPTKPSEGEQEKDKPDEASDEKVCMDKNTNLFGCFADKYCIHIDLTQQRTCEKLAQCGYKLRLTPQASFSTISYLVTSLLSSGFENSSEFL